MKRSRTAIVTAVALVAAAVPATALGGGNSGAHTASNHTVILKGLSFSPETLRIHRGDTVTWKWEDAPTPHNVTSSKFHSSSTRTTGSYTVRFNHAGTFNYHCTIHSFMKAKIIVH
jgi:plastocyanin